MFNHIVSRGLRFTVLLLLLSAVACERGKQSGTSDEAARPATAGQHPPEEVPVIAIATLMSHPALDQVTHEVKAALRECGYSPELATFVERNANSDPTLIAGIAEDLAGRNPDLIVAITTPIAEAVVHNAKCPVVFAAVTDPVGAGILDDWNSVRETVTGTSDAWPYDAQLALIREILPEARTIGVLFDPGETASQYGMAEIRRLAPSHGFELVEGPVASVAGVNAGAESLAGRVDAMFLSSDNTVIGGAAGAVRVAIDQQIPLFVGDSGTVAKGGIAAVSVGYGGLGRTTGELACRLLAGERNIPMVVAGGDEIYVNVNAAALMGVEIPKAVLDRATRRYDEIEQ